MFYGGRTTFQELYQELLSVKDAKSELEKSRDELVSRNRELEIKYQDLLLELKQLNVSDNNKIADLQCQLKLKSYELDRCTVLLAEADAKYKQSCLEIEKLAKKVEVLKEELLQCQTNSEKQICTLKLQLRDTSGRLREYETLEAEIDKLIMRTANMPDFDDAEKVLSTYGKDAFISLNSKHRLRQSLNLARRVLQLENDYSELKTELHEERERKHYIEQELMASKSCLAQVSHPTSELIDVILKRDLEILKLKSKVDSLESGIMKLSQSEINLRRELSQASSYEQNLGAIKTMISEMRCSDPQQCASKDAMSPQQPETIAGNPRKATAHRKLRGPVIIPAPSPVPLIHLKKPLSITKLSHFALQKKLSPSHSP